MKKYYFKSTKFKYSKIPANRVVIRKLRLTMPEMLYDH